jgi:hypothetical protein
MSAMKHGLTKKEGFTPEKQSPPTTAKGSRPKHDNDKVKRKVHSSKA